MLNLFFFQSLLRSRMEYYDMVDMIGLVELEEELNREKYMTNTENSSLVCFLNFFVPSFLSFEHVNHLKGPLGDLGTLLSTAEGRIPRWICQTSNSSPISGLHILGL
jgi:hypothetical protein